MSSIACSAAGALFSNKVAKWGARKWSTYLNPPATPFSLEPLRFGKGIDVRGDALQNVVIVKLPFETPGHPLIEARHQEIKQNGGNPFMERSVPEAILRLKQGVGRLIRTAQDQGTVVILDPRILTKQYGRWFLKALPTMPTERIRLNA